MTGVGGSSTPTGDDIVRAFYDRHPYPPPVADLDRYRAEWTDDRRRADAHLLWPAEPYRDDRRILVAGCGTSQAAKYALRWPRARITGIDVSESGLRETDALRRHHRLDNLELRRLPIERAGELGRAFEHVVCTGVLHHLSDPDAGLTALRQVTAPGGALTVMVYAPYGRAGVYLLQDYCRRLGIGSDAADLADLVTSLSGLPQDHPFAALLRHAPDLRHRAGLADALLHPRDRAYSVPELLSCLRRNGCRFGRWLRQAPYLPQCGALGGLPHARRLGGLPIEDQYAAVELFRGTMVRHTVVAYRDDEPAAVETGMPDVDRWIDAVPLRVPGTIDVTRNLPAGAAAVLINPLHTYTDLYLPVTAEQLALVAAIDGRRTVRAIGQAHGRLDAARQLFQQLWWYDQVVFDESRQDESREST